MKFFIPLFLPLALFAVEKNFPAWYYEISTSKEKKSAFFKILVPIVKESQERIREERSFVKSFFNDLKEKTPKSEDLEKISKLAKRYRIKNIYNQENFLKRVCAIPASLVLAQAAMESGWGSSRFVKEANNIFGHWTYGEKGLIPAQRGNGKTHKIRIFDSLEESVVAYMLNLNRHSAYKEFRDLRYLSIKEKNHFGGFEAAGTMTNYSAIGAEYNTQLKNIISQNSLLGYDEAHRGHYRDFLLSNSNAK